MMAELFRPVKPLYCPHCDALWLFWPKEQSGFDMDTLNLKSPKHCDYCESANSEQLVSFDRSRIAGEI